MLTTPLYRAMHRLPNLPQLVRTRTLNTEYNILLALALDKLPILLADQLSLQRRSVAALL